MQRLLTLLLVTAIFVTTTVYPDIRAMLALLKPPSQPDLPRFVSLRADRANARVGPALAYPIAWTFVRSAIPLEIIQRYGNWRLVRDWQGTTGWVHRALLSNRRTAIVAPWRGKRNYVLLRGRAAASAPISAYLQPGLLVSPTMCNGLWCLVTIPKEGVEGYVVQERIWGVYPGELVSD